VPQGGVKTIDREVWREEGCEGLFEVDGCHFCVELGKWTHRGKGETLFVEWRMFLATGRWFVPRPMAIFVVFCFPVSVLFSLKVCQEYDVSPRGKGGKKGM
jgi:hypothetical protein